MFLAVGVHCSWIGEVQGGRWAAGTGRTLDWEKVGGPAHAEPFPQFLADRGVIFVG